MFYTQNLHAAAFLMAIGADFRTVAKDVAVGGPMFCFLGEPHEYDGWEMEFNTGTGDCDPQKYL